MIERKFVSQNIREYQIKSFLFNELTRAGLADVKLQRTPLGDKVVVIASRPGLVVGKGGSNIKRLTKELEKKFGLETPQIEIEEIKDYRTNAAITAEMIANSLERFGTQRFKGVGHKTLQSVMDAGALGIEITISGRVPSSRAKTWRFYQGYLKKCGDISISGVDKAHQIAVLKTGVVGISVTIMPGDTKLPDKIELLDEPQTVVEEIEEKASEKKEVKKAPAKKKEEKATPKKEKEVAEEKPKAKKKEETKKEEEPKKKKVAKKTSTKKKEEKASEKKEVKKAPTKKKATKKKKSEDK